VRLSLGASRGALVRQLLTETTLLSLLGGLAGFGLAVWLLGALEAANFPLPLELTLDLSPDRGVLAFTIGISALAGLLLGLVPALQSTRPDVVSTLKQETAGGGQPGQLRWRTALIITQLTVSLVLLVGAGLFLRSFQQLNEIDPGFGRQSAGMMSIMVPNTRFAPEEGRRYVRRLLDRFQSLPGLQTVGLITNMPLGLMSNGLRFNVDGFTPPRDRDGYRAEVASVDPAFFDAATIPIVEGRGFRDTADADAPGVAVISEAMAQRFWPDGDALGRTIRRLAADEADLRVVGIAANIKVDSLGEAPAWHMYLPYTQTENFLVHFIARTSVDADQAALAMAAAGRALDPEMMLGNTSTIARHLAVSRLLGGLLVGTGTTDLMAFIGAPLVLGVTAVLASYLPARRASRGPPRRLTHAGQAACDRQAAPPNPTALVEPVSWRGVRLARRKAGADRWSVTDAATPPDGRLARKPSSP